MKKVRAATTNRLGMLQYLLDATVQIHTDIEQQQSDEEGNTTFAKLAYQGVLLDFDDTWVVLGYYSDDLPVIGATIKIDNVVAISLGGSSDELSDMSSAEVN